MENNYIYREPNANNCQHKIIVEAHKKVIGLKSKVQMVGSGKFEIQPGSENDKYYCVESCRLGYCNICKICFHKYIVSPETSLM